MVLDPADALLELERLVKVWEAPGTAISIDLRGGAPTSGILVFGLTSHTHALAKAVATLYEADQTVAAVPLVRLMIESAVTAMWIELAGESSTQILLREQARSVRNAYQHFVKAGMPSDAETFSRIDEELNTGFEGSGPTREVARQFEQLCQELQGGETAYASYRAASQISHASMSVADLYGEERETEDAGEFPFIVHTSPSDSNPDSWLGVALLMTMHSTSAWSRIDTTHRDEARMRELHARMGTDFEARFTPKGVENQERREQEHDDWIRARQTGSPTES